MKTQPCGGGALAAEPSGAEEASHEGYMPAPCTLYPAAVPSGADEGDEGDEGGGEWSRLSPGPCGLSSGPCSLSPGPCSLARASRVAKLSPPGTMHPGPWTLDPGPYSWHVAVHVATRGYMHCHRCTHEQARTGP